MVEEIHALAETKTNIIEEERSILELFLSIGEAAGLLRISQATLYGWIHQRRIPYRKHGRRVVFHRQDLEKWSEGQRVEPLGRHQSSVEVQTHAYGHPTRVPRSLKIRRTAERASSLK